MKIESHTQTISLSIHVFELEIPIDEFALSNPNGSTLPPSPNPPFLKDTLKTARKKRLTKKSFFPNLPVLFCSYVTSKGIFLMAQPRERREGRPRRFFPSTIPASSLIFAEMGGRSHNEIHKSSPPSTSSWFPDPRTEGRSEKCEFAFFPRPEIRAALN